MYFGSYGLWNPGLDKYIESPVCEDPWKNYMIKVKDIELEKFSLSNMQNPRTFSEHIESRSKIFSS